ncbi:MAG: PHP domain-containing protein [Clostridia bacterium]|nr:PHP domain-containing protein [Clostridia bacterium]
MKVYLDNAKSFYKANMHCHTTNSDGKATPEEIKAEYMKRGYSVVAYTDHEHIINCSHLTDENFVAITGFEMNLSEKTVPWNPITRQFHRTTHLNFYATTPDNDLTIATSRKSDHWGSDELRDGVKYDELGKMRDHTPEAISKIIEYAHEKGFLVCFNHPVWSLDFEADYLTYEGLDFVEIFNTGCDRSGLYSYEEIFDVMVKHGRQVACIAADDNHNYNKYDSPKSDSFGGWIMINAEKLDYASIIDALKKHNFYASCGPEIYSLTRDGDTVTVKTSPARKISKQTEGRQAGAKIAERGELITEASFKINDNEKVFRITVEDEYGYKAYSQAYPAHD